MKIRFTRILFPVFLLLTFCGCTELSDANRVENCPPQNVILYGDWSGEKYYVVSKSTDNQIFQVNLYDQDLLLKAVYKGKTLQELASYLPEGSVFEDPQNQLLVTKEWQRPIEDTMGERFSVSLDLATLLYNSPNKNLLYVEQNGKTISYEFKGLVDLQVLNQNLAWLKIRSEDHQNESVLFDFCSGEILERFPGNHTIEFCRDFVLLRPDLIDGNPDDKLYLLDMKALERKEVPISGLQKTNIRLSNNGKYALAGEENSITIYETKDFTKISSLKVRAHYDLYENSITQTVSEKAEYILLFDTTEKDFLRIKLGEK